MTRSDGARPPAPDGVLVVDKPAGMTSHDVVGRVRRVARTRRVGHAGTLDPMATGVLVLGLGRATRLLTHLVGADKDYAATIRLGVATSTEDAQGEVTRRTDATGLDPQRLSAAVAALTGDLMQVPSAVSAIKVDGQRSYARVRAGEDVVLAARPVTVSRFDVLAVRPDADPREPSPGVLDVDVAVTVSSGTYVRALARDLGDALGVGGHLGALRRTRVGAFGLAAAVALPELEASGLDGHLLTPGQAAALCFPVWHVDDTAALRLAHGQRLPGGSLDGLPGGSLDGAGGPDDRSGPVAALTADGRLVALVSERDGAVRCDVVLTSPDELPAATPR